MTYETDDREIVRKIVSEKCKSVNHWFKNKNGHYTQKIMYECVKLLQTYVLFFRVQTLNFQLKSQINNMKTLYIQMKLDKILISEVTKI